MIIENNKEPLRSAIDEAEEDTIVEHRLKPVITSGVEVKHQSGIGRFFRQLFADDMKTVRRTFREDVIIPFVQDGLSGIFHDGIDLLIYGSKSGRRGRRDLFGNMKTRYDKIGRSSLSSGSILRRSYDKDDDEDDVEAFDDNLFVFATRGKAETVYNAMEDAIEMYGAISVADIYDLSGITNYKSDFVDRTWGWTSMEDIKIRRRGGKYLLDLPKTENLKER